MGDHRVEQRRRGDHVRGELVGQRHLVRDAGEVDDRVEALLGEDRGDRVGVGAVGLVPGERRALGRRHQVEPDDLVAELGEPDRDDPAEAAGGAGDQDAHQILGDDLAEQAAHPAGGGLARLEDLLVVERLAAQAGGEVGDQADAEDLHARLAGGDRLERGAHADQVPAHDAGHPDLGGGLVVGPGELDVDALVEARVDLLAQRAQARAVEVGEVDEVGADDRARAGEVDVVGDQHRLPGLPALLEAAAAVGQHDGRAAGRGRGTDRVDDRGDALALVEVGAGEEDQQVAVAPGIAGGSSGSCRCGPTTPAARKPGRSVVSISAVASPSASTAGSQPEPRTSAMSWRSTPVSSASLAAACWAAS